MLCSQSESPVRQNLRSCKIAQKWEDCRKRLGDGDWGQVCREWATEGLLWSRDCMSLSVWTGGGGEGEWERVGRLALGLVFQSPLFSGLQCLYYLLLSNRTVLERANPRAQGLFFLS